MKIPVLHRKYGDFQHIIGVCNDKKRERIRNTPKEKRIAAHLSVLAMTGKRKYNRTPYVFVITKRSVILSAKHERIRNILRGETDCHSRLRLACRLGRCFCFAEVSTGHPHRNDEGRGNGLPRALRLRNFLM